MRRSVPVAEQEDAQRHQPDEYINVLCTTSRTPGRTRRRTQLGCAGFIGVIPLGACMTRRTYIPAAIVLKTPPVASHDG
eukprot:scaffold126473_cov32-Tisochrysis_lutea.AAC.4